MAVTGSTMSDEFEYREAAAAGEGPGADDRNRDSAVGHFVINLFNIIIILPLVWVLLM
jgi:hypothetical protein